MLSQIKRTLKNIAFCIPPIKRLATQRALLEAKVKNLELEIKNHLQVHLPILERTQYSKIAIPLDYPPSRKYEPRWGYSQPVEPIIYNWFSKFSEQYTTLLQEMKILALELKNMQMVFESKNLPEPAWTGIPYSPFDLLTLYSIIRTNKPKRFIEIGSGATTCIAHKAIKKNGGNTKIISIDPEPRAEIDAICDEIIREGLECCDLTIFDRLEPGDILFFDGSHRSFVNSDVTVFFIDVLPRIKPGVVIHIHDITIPWDYPSMFLPWYWNEQYLLHIYLMGNMQRIIPLAPTAFICRFPMFEKFFSEPVLDIDIPLKDWQGGGAFWFTHTKPISD